MLRLPFRLYQLWILVTSVKGSERWKWWGLPLSVVLFIWVRDELGSSKRYVQGRQRQVSVGKADQLDRSHTLVVLLHLLGYDLQLRGSSLGRSPGTHNTHHNQSSNTVRELRFFFQMALANDFPWFWSENNQYWPVLYTMPVIKHPNLK